MHKWVRDAFLLIVMTTVSSFVLLVVGPFLVCHRNKERSAIFVHFFAIMDDKFAIIKCRLKEVDEISATPTAAAATLLYYLTLIE